MKQLTATVVALICSKYGRYGSGAGSENILIRFMASPPIKKKLENIKPPASKFRPFSPLICPNLPPSLNTFPKKLKRVDVILPLPTKLDFSSGFCFFTLDILQVRWCEDKVGSTWERSRSSKS